MEVTQTNFDAKLPEIKKAVESCTFLSIDCEFTGLNITRNINTFDSPKEYYEKLARSCKEFLVIQYGLTTFRYDPDNNNFKQSSFNFYIFRRPANKNLADQRFLCQSSSIDFLVQHGFDFNKLFKEGIPYLNQKEVEKYRSNLEESYKRKTEERQENGNDSRIPIPDDARPIVDDIIEKIETFLESEENEIQLPKCNSFIRRLIYQTREERYSDTISLETRPINRDRILFAVKLQSKEHAKQREKGKYEEQLEELESFIGFSRILRLVIDSNKLVVGHNLVLDFLHTLDKFVSPLPQDYEEFKEMAHGLFPTLLDTKYMSSQEPLKGLVSSSILKDLLDAVSKSPFEIPEVVTEVGAEGYIKSDAKEHEAGYDAFITGLSFLAMWKYLGTSASKKDSEIFSNFDLLEPYINRIFLMILMDNQYMNMTGEDPYVSKDHVFYMTFPKEWTTNNISQLFSPFGNIHVAWIDESSAYVSLYKRDQAAVALNSLAGGETYTIMTHARRRAILEGINTPLPSPLTGRKRKSMEPPPTAKKRRTGSLNRSSSSKRSIDRIDEMEEQVEADETAGSKISKKTFAESASWD